MREWLNEVTLVGRVSGAPVSRDLPSGDAVVTLRLVVPRAPHRGSAALRKGKEGAAPKAQVDTIDIACWTKGSQRTALRLQDQAIVRVEGALHRRFFRAGGGAASRYEVEARSIRRA